MLPLAAMGQNRTVSGTVSDAKSGETLIGATVVDTRSGKGAVTNPYGRFSLTLPSGDVELKVQYVGYEPQFFSFTLNSNRQLNVRLTPSLQLNEVVIVGERVGDTRSSQMSATEMTVEKIKAVPVMFGEADIIKALQLMPGVQSGSEGNSGMYVRGGGPDENLFLLDGVPLYNVSHLGGFFSAFNTDAVKNVTLYKGMPNSSSYPPSWPSTAPSTATPSLQTAKPSSMPATTSTTSTPRSLTSSATARVYTAASTWAATRCTAR